MNEFNTTPKTKYEFPAIDVVKFSCEDIITVSGIGDENQGEWDPQENG